MRWFIAKPIGQLLLIAAFAGQWLFLERIADEQQTTNRTVENAATARVFEQQYLLMYYQTKDADFLKRAARERTNALIMNAAASGYKEEEISEILSKVDPNKIGSAEDYNKNFIPIVATYEPEMHRRFQSRLSYEKSWRRGSWYFVFVVSIVGLGLTWWHEFNERKNASATSEVTHAARKRKTKLI
jgi:hypothetical protein